MAVLALTLYGAFLAYGAFRIRLHARRTGASPVHVARRPGPAERLAASCTALGLLSGFVAPALHLVGSLRPLEALTTPGVRAAGILLMLAGIAAWKWAVDAIGETWRLAQDSTERTRLVTGGPFASVRNPIYASLVLVLAGLALLVPNPVALTGVALLAVGVEVQVRVLEEPHLLRVHGDEYLAYVSTTGRFVPRLGRFRLPDRSGP